ncbi:MAG: hypothetical protein ACI9DC_002593 [Gammaproteobacteria bacterium]
MRHHVEDRREATAEREHRAAVQGDSAKEVEIKRVAFDTVVASLLRPAATDTGDDTDKPTRFEKRIQLGEFSVSPGSRIALTDPSVKPPLKVDVLVNKLTAGPIDTVKPSEPHETGACHIAQQEDESRAEGVGQPTC